MTEQQRTCPLKAVIFVVADLGPPILANNIVQVRVNGAPGLYSGWLGQRHICMLTVLLARSIMLLVSWLQGAKWVGRCNGHIPGAAWSQC